jgi:hypothetical protein
MIKFDLAFRKIIKWGVKIGEETIKNYNTNMSLLQISIPISLNHFLCELFYS